MKKHLSSFLILAFVLYFLFLIRPAILGQLGGTFKASEIPVEYLYLEERLSSDKNFYRTFWIPSQQLFGYYSNIHPAINGLNYFEKNSPLEVVGELRKEDTKENFELSGVKYVIVPYDSKGEIFIKDRKYSEDLYKRTIEDLKDVGWLKKIEGFGKIAVFENLTYKDHVWSPNSQLIESYEMINPTKYIVNLKNARNGDLIVFSENYDAHWWAIPTDEDKLSNLQKGRLWGSNPYQRLFNSFIVRREGDYSVEIFYLPQRWVEIGSVISLTALITIVLTLIILSKPHKWLKKLKNAKIRL